ncbi:hypothetical protein FRX31_024650, partial [Thalictrum thalictroides]
DSAAAINSRRQWSWSAWPGYKVVNDVLPNATSLLIKVYLDCCGENGDHYSPAIDYWSLLNNFVDMVALCCKRTKFPTSPQ